MDQHIKHNTWDTKCKTCALIKAHVCILHLMNQYFSFLSLSFEGIQALLWLFPCRCGETEAFRFPWTSSSIIKLQKVSHDWCFVFLCHFRLRNYDALKWNGHIQWCIKISVWMTFALFLFFLIVQNVTMNKETCVWLFPALVHSSISH